MPFAQTDQTCRPDRNEWSHSQVSDKVIEGWIVSMLTSDVELQNHAQRVSDMAVALARTLHMSTAQTNVIRWGALLHDLGKLLVPDEIEQKPGALTEREQAVMQLHPIYGYQMLSNEPLIKAIPELRPVLLVPLYHHEQWDGSGYPYGLKGRAIPIEARVCAVADVWDALCSDRPYRPAWSAGRARDYICERAGTAFDPRVVKAFAALVG